VEVGVDRSHAFRRDDAALYEILAQWTYHHDQAAFARASSGPATKQTTSSD
jgi:hypothetical protein